MKAKLHLSILLLITPLATGCMVSNCYYKFNSQHPVSQRTFSFEHLEAAYVYHGQLVLGGRGTRVAENVKCWVKVPISEIKEEWYWSEFHSGEIPHVFITRGCKIPILLIPPKFDPDEHGTQIAIVDGGTRWTFCRRISDSEHVEEINFPRPAASVDPPLWVSSMQLVGLSGAIIIDFATCPIQCAIVILFPDIGNALRMPGL
jgi:hypothetical protein